MEEKYQRAEFIVDLLELKNETLRAQQLSVQTGMIAQNPMFYSLLDSLISHFMDKYQIPFEIVKTCFYKRKNHPPHPNKE